MMPSRRAFGVRLQFIAVASSLQRPSPGRTHNLGDISSGTRTIVGKCGRGGRVDLPAEFPAATAAIQVGADRGLGRCLADASSCPCGSLGDVLASARPDAWATTGRRSGLNA